jgi:hypothetical protein
MHADIGGLGSGPGILKRFLVIMKLFYLLADQTWLNHLFYLHEPPLSSSSSIDCLILRAQEFFQELYLDASNPLESACKGVNSYGTLFTFPANQIIG